MAATLARLGGGAHVPDRSLLTGAYLDAYVKGKLNLKPRTLATNREIIELYWKPAIGHLRLVDVRDHHVAEAIRVMLLINQPVPVDTSLSELEMLRRMVAARADDERREVAAGEKRHKKSAKPLSPARIIRAFAVLRAAMNAAVPGKIMASPCAGVELPRSAKVRPMAWTERREAAYRSVLDKRLRAADRELTAVEKQEAWASSDLRPSPVMVWLPSHTGRFLDFIEDERLYALFCVAAYCGLRRDEVIGLTWAETDLDQGAAQVLETGGGSGPKSNAGYRTVPMQAVVVQALKAWRAQQAADRLAWGRDWTDNGLVFTREDGTAVPGQWVSVKFETLAYRGGLPPVRFHDLRHGAASLAKASGADSKYIAALLGHSRTSFTDDVYVTLFPEVAKATAEAAAAIVPRAGRAPDGARKPGLP